MNDDYLSKDNSKFFLCEHSMSVSSPHPPRLRSPFPTGEGKRVIPNSIAFQLTSFHFNPYKAKRNILLESICTHNRAFANFFNKIFLFFAMQNYMLE